MCFFCLFLIHGTSSLAIAYEIIAGSPIQLSEFCVDCLRADRISTEGALYIMLPANNFVFLGLQIFSDISVFLNFVLFIGIFEFLPDSSLLQYLTLCRFDSFSLLRQAKNVQIQF